MDYTLSTGRDMEEHPSLTFCTNGLRGGDGGHGGWTRLTVNTPNTGATLRIGDNVIELDGLMDVSITVFGDWEHLGFIDALIDMGTGVSKLERMKK